MCQVGGDYESVNDKIRLNENEMIRSQMSIMVGRWSKSLENCQSVFLMAPKIEWIGDVEWANWVSIKKKGFTSEHGI